MGLFCSVAPYLDVMNGKPLDVGQQIGLLLPSSMQLLSIDLGDVAELALVDHATARVIYQCRLTFLPGDPVTGMKRAILSQGERSPEPAYKAVMSDAVDRVFTDYLVESYQIIISDDPRTGQGVFGWERLILVALDRKLHVYYCQQGAGQLQQIPDREAFEQLQGEIWGRLDDRERHLAIVCKRPLEGAESNDSGRPSTHSLPCALPGEPPF